MDLKIGEKLMVRKKMCILGSHGESYNAAIRSCANLINPSCHIDEWMNVQTTEEKRMNMLRLKTIVNDIWWLHFNQ